MRLLFDQNISFRLLKKLEDVFPDAQHVRRAGLENSSDKEIWEFAKDQKYTIVTFDSDLYDFSVIWGSPPKIIWIRTGNLTTNGIDAILRKHHEDIMAFELDKELTCLQIIEKPLWSSG